MEIETGKRESPWFTELARGPASNSGTGTSNKTDDAAFPKGTSDFSFADVVSGDPGADATPVPGPSAAASAPVTQATAVGAQAGDMETEETSAADEFLELMRGTAEEKYFRLFLARHGLTEEEFEQLPPEKKQELIEEFKREMEKNTTEALAEDVAAYGVPRPDAPPEEENAMLLALATNAPDSEI